MSEPLWSGGLAPMRISGRLSIDELLHQSFLFDIMIGFPMIDPIVLRNVGTTQLATFEFALNFPIFSFSNYGKN
jgi:hypothetical protein